MGIVRRFWRNESGSTIVEYALIAAFISMGLIVSFNAIGAKINAMMTPVANGLN